MPWDLTRIAITPAMVHCLLELCFGMQASKMPSRTGAIGPFLVSCDRSVF